MDEPHRRDFIKDAGLATAALTLATAPAVGRVADRLPVAVIGCGGMGGNHLGRLVNRPDVRVAYVCDPDKDRLAKAAKTTESQEGGPAKPVTDMRRVFDDRDVKAVWIATPDHWHAPAAILAADAGKHVYVEKPCSHNLREGRLMIDAARRNKVAMQVGTQSRSTEHVIEAMKRLHGGVIGEILVAKVWNSQRRANIGHAKPGELPSNINYDLWVGPAPMVPYQSNRLHYDWHWWFNFGTGDIGNDGVHDIDIGRWGLGIDRLPDRVSGLGGKYAFDDDQQFPDTQYVVFEYDTGDGVPGNVKQLVYEHRIWSPYSLMGHSNGNAFYGTRGYMILGKGGGWQLFGEGEKLIQEMAGGPDLDAHHANFLACVRSGERPNADIEINHPSTALCHLGNIVCRLGRSLRIDPIAEAVTGDQEANVLLGREYRDGHWAVPSKKN